MVPTINLNRKGSAVRADACKSYFEALFLYELYAH